MELTYVTIVVLASMVFVLSGMVGYLYWQQTRMLQHIQSLAIVVSTQLTPPAPPPEIEPEEEKPVEEEDDDRVSVKEEETVEKVEGPSEEPKVDVDDLQDKTKKQLQEMLTAKGIPFSKTDAKPILIQLLKATA